MKKISTIVMALLMVVSLSQCKKNEQNASDNQGEAVTITLDVNDASTGSATSGSRVIVNPATGTVDFENGDQIIVASGGKYVGTLTYNGTLFTGAISNATEGYPLQFYFLGNVTPAETLTSGITESCSVVISDQTEHLPVISAAPSDENYASSTTDYTAQLLNKCALVKFNVTTASEAAICVTGFNNKVTVNFMDNTLTNSQESNGVITLPTGNGEKWAILLPQEAMDAGEQGSAYSQDGVYIGTRGAVPAITENGYLTTGIEVTVTTEVNPGEVPIGAIDGKFTINANGDQIYFSQGNLQYQASTNTWRFAENQWDYVGDETLGTVYENGVKSDNSLISSTYAGWIDLFGWGTSGYHNSSDLYNVNYQPWSTSTSQVNSSYNYYGYGPSTNMTDPNLAGTSANYDWGVYNPINNGGNTTNQWRTLTQSEWNYVFNTRTTPSGIRYAKAQVNYTDGVILLPDDWSSSTFSLSSTNNQYAMFSSNTITAAQWTFLENTGAVFLPAAGGQLGTSVNSGIGSCGYYWSASYYDSNEAHYVNFSGSNLYTSYFHRCYRFSVRVVCPAEN